MGMSSETIELLHSAAAQTGEPNFDLGDREYLAEPKVVIVGDGKLPESQGNFQDSTFVETGDLETTRIRLEKLSSYHPVLLILRIGVSEEKMEGLHVELGKQLFYRVIHLVSAERYPSLQRHSSLLQNPCDPVLTIFESDDSHDQLERAVADFFTESQAFAKTTSQLLRFDALTERQSRIVTLVARGVPNKKISKLIGVSVKTIEKGRKEIYKKLDVSTSAEVASLVTFKNHFRWPGKVPFPVGRNSRIK